MHYASTHVGHTLNTAGVVQRPSRHRWHISSTEALFRKRRLDRCGRNNSTNAYLIVFITKIGSAKSQEATVWTAMAVVEQVTLPAAVVPTVERRGMSLMITLIVTPEAVTRRSLTMHTSREKWVTWSIELRSGLRLWIMPDDHLEVEEEGGGGDIQAGPPLLLAAALDFRNERGWARDLLALELALSRAT